MDPVNLANQSSKKNMFISKTCLTVVSGCLIVILSSCNKAATTSTTTTTDTDVAVSTGLSLAMAKLAVSSPTAVQTSSTASNLRKLRTQKGFWAKVKYNFLKIFMPQSIAAVEGSTAEALPPFSEMMGELDELVAAGDATSLATVIGSNPFSARTSNNAGCYGPTLTDNATGTSVNRPSGDLGIFLATASDTDTEACAAAQLNALVNGSPQFGNKIVQLQIAAILASQADGVPEVGSEEDVTAEMPEITGLTITEAKITRLANDANGDMVFKTDLDFTQGTKTGTITVYHTPQDDDNEEFVGLIQAVLPHTPSDMSGNGEYRGLSIVYQQEKNSDDQKVLSYVLEIAANRALSSNDFFSTTTGRVDYTKTAFGEDGHRIITTVNQSTNATTMHYAWQAGQMDGATRNFAINVTAADADGAQTGVAYFGFGAGIHLLTDDTTTMWATKMHCNWLNQLSSGPSISKVQGQTISLDVASGKFIPVTNNIAFAPTDTCQNATAFTITNGNPTYLNGTRTVTAHELVDPGALGTIPGLTVPSFTLPTE